MKLVFKDKKHGADESGALKTEQIIQDCVHSTPKIYFRKILFSLSICYLGYLTLLKSSFYKYDKIGKKIREKSFETIAS